MMLTEMPVRKPVITECETNRVYRPSRASPAPSMRSPAISVSSVIAPARCAGATEDRADPAARAAALVVVTTIRRVLEVRPPATRPAALAYSPLTGLTPASRPEAMPSGTLPMAPGTPANISPNKVERSGSRLRQALSLTHTCRPSTASADADPGPRYGRKPAVDAGRAGDDERRTATTARKPGITPSRSPVTRPGRRR